LISCTVQSHRSRAPSVRDYCWATIRHPPCDASGLALSYPVGNFSTFRVYYLCPCDWICGRVATSMVLGQSVTVHSQQAEVGPRTKRQKQFDDFRNGIVLLLVEVLTTCHIGGRRNCGRQCRPTGYGSFEGQELNKRTPLHDMHRGALTHRNEADIFLPSFFKQSINTVDRQ
jgi:hypothetical protein